MASPRQLPPSIPALLRSNAASIGQFLAVVDGQRRVTFEEFYDLVLNASAAYLRAGLKKRDRVGIWAQNSLEWLIAALGVQSAGGIIVPLNTRLKGREAQYILNKSRARFLVMAGEFLGTRYPELLKDIDLPTLERRIVIGGTGDESWDSFVAPVTDADRAAAAKAIDTIAATDTCFIIFTSGTTGNPKGVMAGHGQCLEVYRLWAESVGVRPGDRYLIVNPFFHTFGYGAGILSCLIMGATIYPQAIFDVPAMAETIARERITVLPGSPAVFQSILDSGVHKTGDLKSLRLSVTGASAIAPALIERMRNELGIRSVMAGYGLTETCGTVSMTAGDDSAERVAYTCGRPLIGIEVKCVDEANNQVPTGSAGEIVVRGFNVMQGYFEDAKATAEAMDADGWLHTGDVGIFDADGYLKITDRKKDMFIVGGFNCYPAEIEKIMMSNTGVSQVAVVGVPDHRMGEVGKAYVVPRPGVQITSEEIIAWCREQMANYKVPRYIDIVETLPLTAMGKVQKFELRGGVKAQS